jgi:hypothetical protein
VKNNHDLSETPLEKVFPIFGKVKTMKEGKKADGADNT